jgi:hypothetical protein
MPYSSGSPGALPSFVSFTVSVLTLSIGNKFHALIEGVDIGIK